MPSRPASLAEKENQHPGEEPARRPHASGVESPELIATLFSGQPTLFPDIDAAAPRRYRTRILPSQDIERLIADRCISSVAPIEEAQVQPASLGLRLGPSAYRVAASFLPGERNSVQG